MTTRSMMIFQLIMCWLLVQPSLQAPSNAKESCTLCSRGMRPFSYVKCSEDGSEVSLIIFPGTKEDTKDPEIWNEIKSAQCPQKIFVLVGVLNDSTPVPLLALQSFKNLETFEVREGNLSVITDKAFSDLPTIKQIILKKAGIRKLEMSAFQYMDELEEINLESNNITEINAKVFLDMRSLHTLQLSKNQITKVSDEAFTYLKNLITLDLSDNQITQVKQEMFYGLSNLMILNLTNNALTKLEYQPFLVLTSLKTLILASNKIETIMFNTFQNLKNLENLSLRNNKLSLPNTDLFNNTFKINSLDLSENGLKAIPFDMVQSLYPNFMNQSIVHLQGNNFTCNCQLSWMLTVLNDSKNENLKKSLASLSCFFEEDKETMLVSNNATEMSIITNETNNAGVLVDGKQGQMRKLSELHLDQLPCPKMQPEMDSSHSSSRRENAHLSESSSAKVQIALGMQLFVFILTAFLI